MGVFASKWFARFARKQRISERDLCRAAADVRAGDYDADLGGGVFKQRVARRGGGRSGGFRVILLFNRGPHVFFVYGFPKSAQANLKEDELMAFRKLADVLLAYRGPEIGAAISQGGLMEIACDDQDQARAQAEE